MWRGVVMMKDNPLRGRFPEAFLKQEIDLEDFVFFFDDETTHLFTWLSSNLLANLRLVLYKLPSGPKLSSEACAMGTR
ncbi:hypothetical protein EVAR_63473_1 [Eumeta japonica]|uniref:Uncharacterized protein n=1 Tax=Eumeta variegata TaxID=151549 RepID=A0A4C1YDI3_EUMVA|nr:hypothetical protein EVAR_63473_1 [Eumeta japonica]